MPFWRGWLGDQTTIYWPEFRFWWWRQFAEQSVVVDEPRKLVKLGFGDDHLTTNAFVGRVVSGFGDDEVVLNADARVVSLGFGDDTLTANGFVRTVNAGFGDDEVFVQNAKRVSLGAGNDSLTIGGDVDVARGGGGFDVVTFANAPIAAFDIEATRSRIELSDRFTGESIVLKGFEQVGFSGGQTLSAAELVADFGPSSDPYILIGDGTQAVTVNNPDATVSVVWDRAVQQAVIDTDTPVGPTLASRAYAMLHTSMYDAWASLDPTAVRVSRDGPDQDNALLEIAGASDAQKIKAMSYAAYNVLATLFPDQKALFEEIMTERYGFSTSDDGSIEAAIGIDAAEDLLADRLSDGSNQLLGYASLGSEYVGRNGDPDSAGRSIENWTPEFNVVDDPSSGVQAFLTSHWGNVESFALDVVRDGNGDIVPDASGDSMVDYVSPPAPKGFFAEGFEGSFLDLDARTITLNGGDVTLSDGQVSTTFRDGETIDLFADLTIGQRADLKGQVVSDAFIGQAEAVVAYSSTLSDTGKLVAEFYEDGGGTAFPPGTWMTYAQYVSARDDNDTDEDAQMFMTIGNAVMDAGIATWQAKIDEDYARPIRVIRDLGSLGLIGEALDENGDVIEFDAQGDPIYFIEAFGGFDSPIDPANGLGTMLMPATEFVTFQRPGDSSPPFAEYTSGHSAFSRAGAEVLRAFTGSDAFGATVVFEPGSSQFEIGVPNERGEIELKTFVESDGFNGSQDLSIEDLTAFLIAGTSTTDAWNDLGVSAADQAGISRLFGGIHFQDGDINGRELGAEVGLQAYDLALKFINGVATDVDRPFNDPIDFV